jgi:hypothetical protein
LAVEAGSVIVNGNQQSAEDNLRSWLRVNNLRSLFD